MTDEEKIKILIRPMLYRWVANLLGSDQTRYNWQVAKASLSPNCEEPAKIGFTARHLRYFRQPINSKQLTGLLDVGIATGSVSSLMA